VNAELGRRVAFTLGALLVYRMGTYIPLPGIEPAVWGQLFRSGGRLLQSLDAAGGGAIGRLSIFALGITPYLSAAVVIQVIGLFFRGYRRLLNTGEQGRRRIQTYTRAFTVVIALLQSYGIAYALIGISGLVMWPGTLFVVGVTLTLTASSLFLVWLADRITERGLGNGIALFLCVSIVASLPHVVAYAFEVLRQGVMTERGLAGVVVLAIALVAVAVLMERAQRRLRVTYRLPTGGETPSFLVFKLNGAGLVPSLLATWVIAIPPILALFGSDRVWWENLRLALQQGQPLYMLCFAPLVFFFVYLYTAFVVDPNEAADKLQRYGGSIPDIAPGEATAEHIDNVISRVTVIGAIYFVAICLIPEVLLYRFDLPFYLGGPSLLILVCTVIDIQKQARVFASVPAGGSRQ
jgi:preprotein translocase subunit SecY